MSLQRAIRQLREKFDLTQGQLEVKSSVSRSSIAMIEQGSRENPTVGTILKLAIALDTTVDPILRLAGYLPPIPEAVPGEQEAAALFRALSPIYRECILITLRALVQARQSCHTDMPTSKDELLELINRSWYNLNDDQRDRIRSLVLEAVKRQAETQGGEQQARRERAI